MPGSGSADRVVVTSRFLLETVETVFIRLWRGEECWVVCRLEKEEHV